MKRIVIPVVVIFLCGLALVVVWLKLGTASREQQIAVVESGVPAATQQVNQPVTSINVVFACLSVSPLVTLSSINEHEKLAGAEGIKKLVYLKIGSFSHKAKMDLSNMESVMVSDRRAVIELMQLGGEEVANDFLSVSNVFSSLILAGREYDERAFNILKIHQSALEEKFDVAKILDYATSPVVGIRDDVLSLYREYCLERIRKDGDPLANEIINYIDEL